MIFKNSFNYLAQFIFFFTNKTRNFYLNSNIYNKKISKINDKNLEYRPSQSLLDCLIKYDKKKKDIENFYLNSIWENYELKEKDYKKLHSFFWLFSLDLKSSKKSAQKIILNWIEKNHNYNNRNWDMDILSKRIIAWLSNTKLTYDDATTNYKEKFNGIIQKQINHLINEIDRSEYIEDKILGSAAIILAGLSYGKSSKYLDFGLNSLKKVIKFSLDGQSFPRSRNLGQLNLHLKYLVLIREWLKESQTDIPEYIDETIYYLGQSYSLTNQNIKKGILFNGNNESNNQDFNMYLSRHGYRFKSDSNEKGGYAVLKNKNISLIMDVGESPEKKFSNDYQAGALSFEVISDNKKLISNCGYFSNYQHQLNRVSKSTATHSTLIIDNQSSCKLRKKGVSFSNIDQGLKIIKKNVIFEKNYWSIDSSHDGYLKNYGIIHNRQIEFFPEQNKFIGKDNLIKKKNFKSTNFEIRFHLSPGTKIMKTQDGNSIFIELENEGWKFNCVNYNFDIETGLYFGKKNSYVENQNMFISGMTQNENQTIKWVLSKIT